MKWKGRRQSSNIDDRRGQRGGMGGGGFNPMLIAPLLRMLFSKTGLIIVGIVIIFSVVTGTNPLNFLGNILGDGQGFTTETSYTPSPKEDELAAFTATILADTEEVWNQQLDNYREPTLVLFSGGVSSACGMASSATGPFYCPTDEKLYIDLGFFEEMDTKLNAPGDFAEAYVIAHEVGHHIQKITGVSDQVQRLRGELSEKEYNQYSVRLELQADFLAGVWAHHSQRANKILEEGDLEEALNAANAIGDDRLQKQAGGQVVPDSFTHGTSAQRMKWFKKGFDTGDIRQGDTFTTGDL